VTPQESEMFMLPDIVDYFCKLLVITDSNTLILEVFKTNIGGKRYSIKFDDVIALKIPTTWINPVFYIADKDEFLKIAPNINSGRLKNLSLDEIVSTYYLYKINGAGEFDMENTFYVFAGKVSIEEKTRKRK
jgi:hypothetical protein